MMLVDFAAIADCLEPEASACSWRVTNIDGMLRPHASAETLDDAYAYADASVASSISWRELREYAATFSQIYDVDFDAVGAENCGLKVRCFDSSQWEVITDLRKIGERIRAKFNDTHEEADR